MLTHNLLDGLGGLISIVEGDRGNEVMGNVGLNDAVEQVAADESKFTINGCRSTTNVVPAFRVVVGKRGISMLKESNSN